MLAPFLSKSGLATTLFMPSLKVQYRDYYAFVFCFVLEQLQSFTVVLLCSSLLVSEQLFAS